ncbi:hypothetical protein TWF225_001787 [Orbilia oligospora]|uniref:N-acetyltransferase domain-containing protein n=1 Tax=Orbilia oligospora TaxID=2813651 RepID=A0A7C8P4R6_ORBOL|nr:hypothetical protein TWF751_004544 [Orbilia oligospora]KAF3190816.1 hypothetical protein TWF225_001787 [Orbilia oligospora]KAF3255738.1 hypothetical protein TWF217_006555 [Orbilia oligospora]KAF3265165.1 hypothetical protein TWF128_000458 [Orbilia oligospora]KAF3274657.1 hypothetical protein TWF132_003282 [Orbilia oligospora]
MVPNSRPILPPGFEARRATYADVEALTQIWFDSFNATHDFWKFLTPENDATRKWLNELWTLGIKAGPSVFVTWVAEDLSKDRKVVAFTRWQPPQPDGSIDVPFPDFTPDWDEKVADALWGGIAKFRRDIMGNRPHWFAEFTCVDKEYQDSGIGPELANWGCRQAKDSGLEIYCETVPFSRRVFFNHMGVVGLRSLTIPKRPGVFDAYEIIAGIRPPTAPMYSPNKTRRSKL